MSPTVERARPAPSPVHGAVASDPTSPSNPRRSRVAWANQFLFAALLSLLCAGLANGLLNLIQSGGDIGRLVSYDLRDALGIFIVSTGVVWLLLLLLIGITGRFFLSCAALVSAATVVGVANYEKLRVRNEPLLPSDFGFAAHAGFLADMVSTGILVLVGTLVALTFLIAVLLGRISRRTFPRLTRRTHPTGWRRWMVARGVLVLVPMLMFTYIAHFNEPGNLARGAYQKAGANWAFWFQKVNYARHGAVAGFLYNLSTAPMETPAGYGEERMAHLADRYERLASRMNQGADTTALDAMNLVIVLSESFVDPTEVEGVSLERDPIPFTRRLMSSTVNGHLLTQHFGGGTANMEYEALTGLSLSQFAPQHDTPYSMSVHERPGYPSIIGHLTAAGHRATGIHPYMPTMYKRAQAYRALGFDEFVTQESMADRTTIDDSAFIADSAAFEEAVRRMRSSPGPDVVNVVTMQNHYPTDDSYDDPMKVTGVHPDAVNPLGNLARGLEHSDEALRAFIAELQRSDEPTAVVFYGDHQPALWGEDPVISKDDDAMHRAPFFLWSNTVDFDTEELPLVSPVFFLPTLFRELGVELPPYYALLSRLQEHIGAMGKGAYYAPDGRPVTDPDGDPQTARLLEDYRLLQYDFAVGERYAVSRMFPQEP